MSGRGPGTLLVVATLILIVALGWLLPVRSWTLALADYVCGLFMSLDTSP